MTIKNLSFQNRYRILFLFGFLSNISCNSKNSDDSVETIETLFHFYYGADLSYVNEMEDCGATYKNSYGIVQDPYTIFKNEGANLVRIRLMAQSNMDQLF